MQHPRLLTLSLLTSLLHAQDDPARAEKDPDNQDPGTRQATENDDNPRREKVIVSATRRSMPTFDVPYTTDVIGARRMRERGYRTVPQALRDTPGVMVQETAHSQGSPYIRGFTSFRTLMQIDGVRLNNSVFRSGPNQYLATVDAWSLDRIEVVKGPSSVLNGSDAIGGAISMYTRNPWTYDPQRRGREGNVDFGGRTYMRYADAEDSLQARAEVSLGIQHDNGSSTGILIGGTFKDFGDLEGGADTGVQPYTGYRQKDFDLKLEHYLDDHQRLVFLHQSSRQDDAPRTHRTVNAIPFNGSSIGSDLIREFDQHRYLSYLQYHGEDLSGPFDSIRANLSWQVQKEERYRQRSNFREEFRGFDVGTLGAWVQFENDTSAGRFTYGVEYYRDSVDSFSRRPGNTSVADTIQGPIADDATYDLLGVYVQDEIDLADELTLTVGGRFTYAAAEADRAYDPVNNNQTTLDDSWSNLVGSARVRWGVVPSRLNVFGGISQGFRAPNLSDLSRLDSARSNEIETPAPNLDPEEYTQFEIGTRFENDTVAAEASWFYTDISDQILRFPTGAVVNGDNEVTKANVGDGYIQGIELGTAVEAPADLTVFGNLTWMEGRISNFGSPGSTLSNDYPTRLMPLTWQAGVRWDDPGNDVWIETVLIHANRQDKLSFSDQRDTSRVPPGGTPSYTVWNIRAGLDVGNDASIFVALDNLTDADYRIHGSGLNGPGRNLIIGGEISF